VDPVATTPRLIAWLPTIAVGLALAAIAMALLRRRQGDDDRPNVLALVPLGLLFAAALAALVGTVAETAIDSRVGLREASLASLALICASPVLGYLVARLRYGPPGERTFHQQIAANRVASITLLIILAEVLAVTGFVVGGSVGVVFGSALAAGLALGAGALMVTAVVALVALRRGSAMVLGMAGAVPADQRHSRLANVVAELALAAGMKAPAVFVVNDPSVNAFSVGRDANSGAIAVTTGLLERLDREELQGVIAHELAHVRNLDARYSVLLAVFVGAIVALGIAFAAMTSNMHIEGDGIADLIIGIIIALLIALFGFLVKSIATFAARGLQGAVSREREFLADACAVELTRNPEGLIRALAATIEQDSLGRPAGGTEHLWFVNPLAPQDQPDSDFFATHPLTKERIARLRILAGELERGQPPSGSPTPGAEPQVQDR
jgi:heat shock protein HtpX